MRPWVRRTLRGVHRALGPLSPTAAFSRTYAGIPGRVHVDDPRLRSDAADDVRHYRDVGLSAMEHVAESLAAGGRTFAAVSACLVLPSGYGRVVRHLRRELDASRITACDVDRRAVRFCARELGVRPLFAHPDVRRNALRGPYDLAFVGSLLTHLQPAAGLDLVDVLVDALAPDGTLVFSTQGASCLAHLAWYGAEFAAAEARCRDDVEASGIAFVPYRGQPRYGITIHRRDWLEDAVRARHGDRLELVRFRERGWDRHQDVWTYRRVRA